MRDTNEFKVTCGKCGKETISKQKGQFDIEKSNDDISIYTFPDGGYWIECSCDNEVVKRE